MIQSNIYVGLLYGPYIYIYVEQQVSIILPAMAMNHLAKYQFINLLSSLSPSLYRNYSSFSLYLILF